ncbi:hypothetical protein ACFLX7_03995 [Chloroflexota bacterium]
MQARYLSQVQFIIIYTTEAHPVGSACPYTGTEWTDVASTDEQGNPLTQPTTYQERVAQSAQMIEELGITVPTLIDEMDNPVWCTYGAAPNIAETCPWRMPVISTTYTQRVKSSHVVGGSPLLC